MFYLFGILLWLGRVKGSVKKVEDHKLPFAF